ncbi:MAG: PIN domain-containing protein [Steroidobacteraceae bacterium]|nr:PIN domain-containing protein [Steroidobacteraceae bacterium]
MIVLDANVLVYAYNSASEHHARCRAWLEAALNGPQQIGFPWQTLLAFVRIATHPRVFRQPLLIAEAVAIVDEWLTCPQAILVAPGEDHWSLLKRQLVDGQASGALVPDAALAALALERGATLCSTDRDFARFRALKLVNPIAAD